jgi:hypothetical protein
MAQASATAFLDQAFQHQRNRHHAPSRFRLPQSLADRSERAIATVIKDDLK